ncbi:FAD-dependent thymidylate synthase [Pseudonocardia sp. NPDC049154]|uniref:FAD-dependent thymidylate synthase n=1 Tax=Pseudonocardia sp. NPDC049154 TaxID=3155501 RepID=UPI0033C7009A
MKVTLVAATQVRAPIYDFLPWGEEAGVSRDGEYLVEFAGRACYQAWGRKNPETRKTRDYVRKNIIGKDHGSVLEHASATFYIEGVSRSLTHEMIRHRAGTAYSELSQRYVDLADVELVVHPTVQPLLHEPVVGARDPETKEPITVERLILQSYEDVAFAYDRLSATLEAHGITGKRAREAAREVAQSMTETKLVMTANYRAWRHILRMRGSEHADAQIRALALLLLEALYDEAPSVFGDYSVVNTQYGQVIEA